MNERFFITLIAIALVGCSSAPTNTITAPEGFANAVMKPDTRMRGTIKTVNDQAQYVIVDFGLGVIPPLQTTMNVYRDYELMGSVQLTGPIRGGVVAADILTGEVAVGDLAILDESESKEDDDEAVDE